MLIIGLFIGTISVAQEKTPIKPTPENEKIQYCAVLKDGAMIVLSEGKQVHQDIVLNEGYMLRSNAILVNKDGKEIPVLNGECVGMDGKVIPTTKKEQGMKKTEEQ